MTHEYLADKGMIQHGYDVQDYQSLLLKQMVYPGSFRVANTFNFKPVLKRLTMMTKIQINKSKKLRVLEMIPVISVTILSVIIAIIISCSRQQVGDFQILNIRGEGGIYNMSKSNFAYILGSDSINNTALLIKKGDLIATENFLHYYNESGETKYNIIENDSVLEINGKISSIDLSKSDNLLPLFEQMTDENMLALKSLQFFGDIPGKFIPYIEKIATLNPKTGLYIDEINEETRSIITLFNPVWIGFDNISTNDFHLLSKFSGTKLVMLSISDSVISTPLPAIKGLEKLILWDMEKNVEIKDDFLANNPQIQSITISESTISDFKFMNGLKNLKELTILEKGTKRDLGFIKEYSNLEVFGYYGEDPLNIVALNEIPSLKWLMLSIGVSQSDFNSIIEKHDKLEIVELFECDQIKDLQPLKLLKNLKGLVVTDSLYDYKTPALLNNLKYLSLPEKVYEDSVYLSSLQKSLPECTIVPNVGFCLGSGWLFSIFPMVIFFRILRKMYALERNEL